MRTNVYQLSCFDEFSCIGNSCENDCCSSWHVHIDSHTKNKYEKNHPEIYKIIARDGGDNMPLDENKKCSFLSKGLCKIHAQHGPEALPKICNSYPRMEDHINNIKFKYIVPSCPEAARILFLSENPLKILEKKKFDKKHKANPDVVNIDGLDNETIIGIFQHFIDRFIETEKTSEESLMSFLSLVHQLNNINIKNWKNYLEKTPIKKNEKPIEKYYFYADEAVKISQKILTKNSKAFPDHKYSKLKEVTNFLYGEKNIAIKWSERIKTDRIDNFLKRHLAVSIMYFGLPYRSQTEEGIKFGKTVADWGKVISASFISVRFMLLTLAEQSEGELSDSEIIGLLHRIYRVLFHGELKNYMDDFINRDFDHARKAVTRQNIFSPRNRIWDFFRASLWHRLHKTDVAINIS